MSSSPLVSLILVVRDGMPYLPQAVESVASQSYRNFELIVQDGASTDGTLDFLRSLRDVPGLEIVSEPDSGIGEAFNRALPRCRGEIIGSICADDLLPADALEQAVAAFREHPTAAVIYGDCRIIDGEGQEIETFTPAPFDLPSLMRCELVPPFAASFFSRSTCGDALHFEATMKTCPDFDLWLRLSHLPIVKVDRTLAIARKSEASGSCSAAFYPQICRDKVDALARFAANRPSSVVDGYSEAEAGIYLWGAESIYALEGASERFDACIAAATALCPTSPRLDALRKRVSQNSETEVAHHELFAQFTPWKGQVEAGMERSFLGGKTRSSYFTLFDQPQEERNVHSSYPAFDEEYFEWIDVMQAVAAAGDRFTMIELGAGWGRWLINGALAAKNARGLSCKLVGVEAEPTHFEWMKQHFEDNGLDPSEHDLVEAAVSDRDDNAYFYAGKADSWYGQALAENASSGEGVIRVPTVSLKTLLTKQDVVDLIDLDVQGAEYTVLDAAAEEVDCKVKRVHIGTHNAEVEAGIRDLFTELGWIPVNDYPCGTTCSTPYGTIKFQDGVQTWVNPNLVSGLGVGERPFEGRVGASSEAAESPIREQAPQIAATTGSNAPSDEEQPLVSMITIVRNGMPHIESCIESMLDQDYLNIEIIVQDGGSTDGTIELLESYGDRIRWASEPDSGHGEAMNRALQRCSGEIIGTCNADDEMLPNAVSWAVKNFAVRPDVGAIYGDYYTTDGRGNILHGPFSGASPYDYERVLCVEDVPPMQAAFFRRTALDKAGLLSGSWLPRFCEDFAFWVRLGLHSPVECVSGAVSVYRIHDGSGSYQPDLYAKLYACKREVLERFFLDPETPPEIKGLRNRALAGLAFWVAHSFIWEFRDPVTAMSYVQLARDEQPDAQWLNSLSKQIDVWLPRLQEFIGEGLALLGEKKYAEALDVLDPLTALDHWATGLHYSRAGCQMGLGRYEEACESVQRELDLHPDHQPSQGLLDQLQATLGNTTPDLYLPPTHAARCGAFSWTQSQPKIDLILPGPPDKMFSWNQREGIARALIDLSMLGHVYWAWDNATILDHLFRSLEETDADLVLISNCDQHMFFLFDTGDKQDFWRELKVPAVCHSSERVLGSPFSGVEYQARIALDTFDAFLYIDELSSAFFEASGKPSLWIPQYVDETLFQSVLPYESRINKVFFRGQVSDFGFPGVYRARRDLLEKLASSPNFDVSEAYRPPLTPLQAARRKAWHRFALCAPATCTGYSSSLYEALACGCVTFQYALPEEEAQSRALFQPGVHFLEYDPSDPERLLTEAEYALAHWQDLESVARQGREECLTKHTLTQRMTEVVAFLQANWAAIAKSESRLTTAA